MRERAPVWAARVFLLAAICVIIGTLAQLPVHNHNHYWPYGHIHYVLEYPGVLISYGISAIGALVAGACAGITLWYALETTFYVALRKPHIRFTRRWATFDNPEKQRREKKSSRYVTYDKPEPLVRGRIGSK